MTASYTPVSISGYNAATVPVDDGTVTAANKISWATIKTKLGDPVNTAFSSINTNLGTAVTTLAANLATAQANYNAAQATYSALTGTMYAPAATGTFFNNGSGTSTVPTGWTKVVTYTDYALRLVSGTAGATGGSTAFSSVLTSRTIAQANMPTDHAHSFSAGSTISWSNATSLTDVSPSSQNDVKNGGDTCVSGISTSGDTITASGTLSGTTSTTGSGTALDFAVSYVDVIYGTKD